LYWLWSIKLGYKALVQDTEAIIFMLIHSVNWHQLSLHTLRMVILTTLIPRSSTVGRLAYTVACGVTLDCTRRLELSARYTTADVVVEMGSLTVD